MTTEYTAARAKRLILEGKLPAGAKVTGDLDLSGTSITALPEGLTVGGGLYLSGTSITALPEGLTVAGGLYLSGTSITALPEGLTVGGGLDLRGTSSTLPTNWISKPGEATRHRAIAVDSEYTLMQTDTGKYSAGCRGPWTKKQALDHWDRSGRTDARAKAFVAAIEAHHIAEPVL